MSIAAAFGARVKTVRNSRGWSQTEVAEALGLAGYPISQPNYSKLETGKRPTSIAEAVVLARILGVSLSALVEGEP